MRYVGASIATAFFVFAAFPKAVLAQTEDLTAAGKAVYKQRIAVAARDIPRGSSLKSDDIQWIDTVETREGQRAQTTAENDRKNRRMTLPAPGWIARAPIRRGERLERPSVAPPDLVKTGSTVSTVYQDSGVTVTLSATAVGTGAYGDTIYIRTQRRNRLRAVIIAENTVKVTQ